MALELKIVPNIGIIALKDGDCAVHLTHNGQMTIYAENPTDPTAKGGATEAMMIAIQIFGLENEDLMEELHRRSAKHVMEIMRGERGD